MLVKPRHIHFAVAHDIHYGHHIARSVHRIGTESVPSTIEHNGIGDTRQLLGLFKLLLHSLDVTRTTSCRWEDEGRPLRPRLQCSLDALT